MQPLFLIGGEHSYFTSKARAYLKWSGLEFEERIATPDVFKSVIVPKAGWPVVPVLEDRNPSLGVIYVQDTSDIIDYCEHTYAPLIRRPALPPPGRPNQRLACFCLELMGDEWMKLPAMHYRWSFPENYTFLQHEWGRMTAPDTTPEGLEELNANVARSMKQFSGSLPFLGVTEETIPGVERSFAEILAILDEHFKHHAFLLGGRPCLADFTLMGPMYAHLHRDPVPGFLMRRTAPRVAEWVDRCNQRTSYGCTKGADPDSAELIDGDVVPATLWPLLAMWHREHAPVLVNTVRLTAEAIGGRDGIEVPRAVGLHDFEVGGVRGRRAAFSFDVWKLQRLLRELEACRSGPHAAAAEAFFRRLAQGGASPLTSAGLSEACRVHRRRGTKSKHGNNLWSGADAAPPVWIDGAARANAGTAESSETSRL